MSDLEPTASAGSTESTSEFWTFYQPGLRFSEHQPGSPDFFADVERHRYELEPHIPEIVQFSRWRGADVLEVGCGIATDGVQFVRNGARYTGVDPSPTALSLAQRRFALEGLKAALCDASATALPFPDESFDLVYSHGVIHHIPKPDEAVAEFHRVLRPGGVVLVMVYHRRSFNYYVNIMVFRRVFAPLLLLPGATDLVSRMTGEAPTVLQGQRALLKKHGWRYIADRDRFLSNNTDGPGNPLSRAWRISEAAQRFRSFEDIQTTVRHLNVRLIPGGSKLAGTAFGRWLDRRFGWHLYVSARK
jgi:SAM-dependent methyltransferase